MELLTVQELAEKLKVRPSWVYGKVRLAKENGFPVLKVGKYLRFSMEAVLEWLKKQNKDQI